MRSRTKTFPASFVLVALLSAQPAVADWTFSNETSSVGLDYAHAYVDPGFFNEELHIAGGLAIGDLNGDGWDDIFAVTGYTFSGNSNTANTKPNLLFIANGDGTFTDRTSSWFSNPGIDRFSSGPLIVDLNDDGRNDLLVGGVRSDGNNIRLYLNQNHSSFSDFTQVSNMNAILAGTMNFGMAAGDTDQDGDLDLFVTHWSESSQAFLLQNNGSAMFTDVTGQRLGGPSLRYTFTPTFADLNNNGWLDLMIASDFLNAAEIGAGSRYFFNDGTGSFSAQGHPVPIPTGPGANKIDGPDENGMGAAVADYDNDGDLDWFVTSIHDPDLISENNWGVTGNRLYQNDGTGQFTDVTDSAGVREGYWGWGACFGDFNNDMHLDLYHVNGFNSSLGGKTSLRTIRPSCLSTMAMEVSPSRVLNWVSRIRLMAGPSCVLTMIVMVTWISWSITVIRHPGFSRTTCPMGITILSSSWCRIPETMMRLVRK